MGKMDDLRYLATRKAKADSLPEDVRRTYQAEYQDICRNMTEIMIAYLTEVICAVDQSKNMELQNASGEVAQAYLDLDIEGFISAVEHFKEILNDTGCQMGFTDVQVEVPWKKEA